MSFVERRHRLGTARSEALTMELQVIIHHDSETAGYWGEFVQLPGCFAAAHSLEELEKSLQAAVALFLEDEDQAALLVSDHVEEIRRYRLSEDRKLIST